MSENQLNLFGKPTYLGPSPKEKEQMEYRAGYRDGYDRALRDAEHYSIPNLFYFAWTVIQKWVCPPYDSEWNDPPQYKPPDPPSVIKAEDRFGGVS
ncbi:MAG: hypothetical protein ABSG38_16070 [Spirochaetia bacterium]|jgi:hypothetical protein